MGHKVELLQSRCEGLQRQVNELRTMVDHLATKAGVRVLQQPKFKVVSAEEWEAEMFGPDSATDTLI